MNHEKLLDLVVHVLHDTQTRMKSMEIAQHAISGAFRQHAMTHSFDLGRYESDESLHQLASAITKAVTGHIAKTWSEGRRCVTGSKTAGWTLGPASDYKLQIVSKDLAQPASNSLKGLVGEYAVMSELLACGWNAAKLPDDTGIDIIATKDGEVRFVQVKTTYAGPGKPGEFVFHIPSRSHDRHDAIDYYYVLVMRIVDGVRHINNFLIISHHLMHSLKQQGHISLKTGDGSSGVDRTDKWVIKVRGGKGSAHVGDFDCTSYVNRFHVHFK